MAVPAGGRAVPDPGPDDHSDGLQVPVAEVGSSPPGAPAPVTFRPSPRLLPPTGAEARRRWSELRDAQLTRLRQRVLHRDEG